MDTSSSAEKRFMRTHLGWVDWVRKPSFIGITFIILVAYAWLLLPQKDAVSVALLYTLIGVYIALVLAWSGLVLSDRYKPEALKMLVSLALIGVFSWLFYRYSGAQWGKLQEFFFNFKILKGNWWILRNGMMVTIMLALIAGVGSVAIGLFVAILRAFNNPTLNIFLKVYVDVFRSIPMVVVMVVIFFALPYTGISLGSIMTTVLALSLGYGAYASESFRAGIESVHYGQLEAARSLGLSRWQTIRKIIMPQAIPVVIPPLTGNLVAMLKETAVASLVAAPELLKKARELYTSKTNPTSLVAAAIIYLIVLVPLVRLVNMLERRVKRG